MTPSFSPDLAGQVALVTGAGRGIGCAICRMLLDCGALVHAISRSREPLEKLSEQVKELPGRLITHIADVSAPDAIATVFDRVERESGRLDILINNAGIGRFGKLESFNPADLDAVLATNVKGAFFCAARALKCMIPVRRGWIINIGSVVSFKGYANQSIYAASKHALLGMTRTLAVEAQEHDIRVSIVMPGGVDTDLVAQSRPDLDRRKMLKPEDVAHTVRFLLSLPPHAAIDQIYLRRAASVPF
ncbi:MAG: SDR family oxidoreductase [Phycisphaeraceae bacterium]|nr:SDR family oxidoreductase [Phycisphaeraceae bacterium]